MGIRTHAGIFLLGMCLPPRIGKHFYLVIGYMSNQTFIFARISLWKVVSLNTVGPWQVFKQSMVCIFGRRDKEEVTGGSSLYTGCFVAAVVQSN